MLAYLRGERPARGIVRALGIHPVSVEHGMARFESIPSEIHLNYGGTAHGGFITTLLDNAMGCAAISVLGPNKGVTTIELKVSFHRPVVLEGGRILAEGRVISAGRRVIFTEGSLADATGRKLATSTSSLMVLDR